MPNKIIKQLKRFVQIFKKECNILITPREENLSEVLPRLFRKFNERKSGIEGITLFKLIEEVVEPIFWLKLNNNSMYKLKDYLNFIIFLSSINATPEGGSQLLKSLSVVAPNADSFLYHLAKFTPEEIMNLTEKLNYAIFQRARLFLHQRFMKKSFKVAIDFTDRPFYGQKSTPEIMGGKQKSSTNWFYRFAAITIIEKGIRFTLAMRPVLPLMEDVEVIDWLINKAEKVIKIKMIEVDRGFFNTKVIKYFIQNKRIFLMPGVKNKRIKEIILKFHRGIGKQCVQYKFYPTKSINNGYVFTIFILKNGSKSPKLSEKPKTNKEILELYHVFATNKIIRNCSSGKLKKISNEYKNRWGIETAFKMINFFQMKTYSKVFVIRIFCYLFSMIIYNLWILCNLISDKKPNSRYKLLSLQLKLLVMTKSFQYLFQIIPITLKNDRRK